MKHRPSQQLAQLYKRLICLYGITLLVAAIPMTVAAVELEAPQSPPINNEAKDRFDEKVKENQDKFDSQINNPGSKIEADPKVKRQREKEERARLAKEAKEEKEEAKRTKAEAKRAKDELKNEPIRDLVEAKSEASTDVVKDGSFTQSTTIDAHRVVRAIRTSAAVPIVNITPEKARFEAIRIAKEEAVRIAVGEEVNASTTILDHGKEDATIARLSTIGSRGGIVALELTKDTQTIDSKGTTRYEVAIKVDVKIYPEQSTPSIRFDVEGIKHGYNDRERLTFSVMPSDDSYIYIFLFDAKNEGTLLVPSRYETSNLLTKNIKTGFPSSRAIQYTLYLDSPLSTEEMNTLLIVTFRQENPITPEISRDFERTLCWINNVDPSMRSANVEVLPIRVYQKR